MDFREVVEEVVVDGFPHVVVVEVADIMATLIREMIVTVAEIRTGEEIVADEGVAGDADEVEADLMETSSSRITD